MNWMPSISVLLFALYILIGLWIATHIHGELEELTKKTAREMDEDEWKVQREFEKLQSEPFWNVSYTVSMMLTVLLWLPYLISKTRVRIYRKNPDDKE